MLVRKILPTEGQLVEANECVFNLKTSLPLPLRSFNMKFLPAIQNS